MRTKQTPTETNQMMIHDKVNRDYAGSLLMPVVEDNMISV